MAFVVTAGASRSTSDHRHSKPNLTLPRRGRQTSDMGGAPSTPPRHTRRVNMRAIFVPALVRVGFALAGTSPALSAPSNVLAIANAAGSIKGSNPCTGATTLIATIGAGTAIAAGGNDHRRRAGRRERRPARTVSSHRQRVTA